MRRAFAGFTLSLAVLFNTPSVAQRPVQRPALPAPQPAVYFPERFDWQHKSPDEVGMDAARLDEAVKLAIASETPGTRDLALSLATTFGRNEPFDTPIGPVKA